MQSKQELVIRSHDTEMIQGIEVSDLSDAEDGDVLMIQDGVWVATTSVSEDDDGISVSLNEVEDVSDWEVATGDVIKWGGSSWDEGTDLVLSEDDVEQMLDESGI